MNFTDLDTYAFRTFWNASETLNFTDAAKKGGMTQSGVSQHIARLEKQLGAPLFARVNRRVLLTEAGRKLRRYIEKYHDELEVLKDELADSVQSLRGRVDYAMPSSCLMTPHFSQLLEVREKEFPEIELKVTLCHSLGVVEKLLNQEVHFGFVNTRVEHPAIESIPFCPEEYVLISRNAEAVSDLNTDQLLSLKFIAHPGVQEIFNAWRAEIIPNEKNLSWSSLTVVGEMNSLDGAIQMVKGGMGATVIAKHCVSGALQKKTLFASKEATNQIYIIKSRVAPIPRRVERVIETFLKMVL